MARKPKIRMSEKLAGNGQGIACRNCGGRLLDVLWTYKVKGGIRRRRRCAHCKHEFTTFEQSLSDAAKGKHGPAAR